MMGAAGFCLTVAGLAACSDDLLYEREGNNRPDSDRLLFEAGIGVTGGQTRAAGNPDELSPLVMENQGWKPLYLHRYVCDNSFDPAYMEVEPNTRGVQVNSMADFLEVHKTFGFQAAYKNGGDMYVYPVESNLINKNDAADNAIWGAKGGSIYWPGDNAMLSIHAWAPFNHPSTMTRVAKVPGSVSFSYEAQRSADGQTDAQAQTDILWAITDCNKSLSENGKAKLEFTHPLSAIKFAVRDVLGGTVESISIKGVMSKGDCVYQLATDENGNYGNTTLGSYVWTNQSDAADFTQKFGVHVNDYNDADRKDQGITTQMPSATFMMIPQEIPADAVIEIKIKPDNNGTQTFETITLSGLIKDLAVPVWEAGKEYVYTISTSSANWTNVFEVRGSYRNNTEIYMPSPADEKDFYEAHPNYEPYYEVISYRYRTNKPSVKENLPWTASHGDGVQYYYTHVYQSFAEKDAILYTARDREPSERDKIPASTWITDTKGLKGNGSVTPDKHPVSFYRTIVTTDWEGDIEMYHNTPYTGNSESNPWNLGTFGGQRLLNTANCYVVDREGWYAIPLYYGNAVVSGNTNSGAWLGNHLPDIKNEDKDKDGNVTFTSLYYSLFYFRDHKNAQIRTSTGGTGKIPQSYYNSARILWQDAYDLVDQVKLTKVNGEDMIVFHVNRTNIQQGNVVLGLSEHTQNSWTKDDPKIVWSWHIWVNEHWLNNKGLSNAFASDGFDTSEVKKSQMQNQGDLPVTVPQTSSVNRTYTISPYNIGWCDAKNVRYLSRYNIMAFTQYLSDGKKSGKTGELPLIQDGRTIQYKYGNNVYFQFGRKDPFVGFLDHENTLKEHYGDLDYDTSKTQFQTISYAIQHPHQLFVGASIHDGENGILYADWQAESGWRNDNKVRTEYYNLWNNTPYDKTTGFSNLLQTDENFTYSKTVYDPSPAGYTIPPVGMFKILYKTDNPLIYDTKGNPITSYNVNGSIEDNLNKLNGYQHDSEGFLYRIYTQRGSTSNFFSLTSTGHRWYATTVQDPGSNFNPQLVYLWTNVVTKHPKDRAAFSMALGKDGNGKYIISPAFNGRKSMARPIRCIRESNSQRN